MWVVQCVPSRFRRVLVLVWAVAQMALMLWYLHGVMRVLLCVLTLLAATWAWGETVKSVQKIVVRDDFQAVVFVNDVAYEADLLGDSLVCSWFCLLHWRTHSRSFWQALLPDMTDKVAYRRLLVWARFGRETNRG